jgi:hypothetical protein
MEESICHDQKPDDSFSFYCGGGHIGIKGFVPLKGFSIRSSGQNVRHDQSKSCTACLSSEVTNANALIRQSKGTALYSYRPSQLPRFQRHVISSDLAYFRKHVQVAITITEGQWPRREGGICRLHLSPSAERLKMLLKTCHPKWSLTIGHFG